MGSQKKRWFTWHVDSTLWPPSVAVRVPHTSDLTDTIYTETYQKPTVATLTEQILPNIM